MQESQGEHHELTQPHVVANQDPEVQSNPNPELAQTLNPVKTGSARNLDPNQNGSTIVTISEICDRSKDQVDVGILLDTSDA